MLWDLFSSILEYINMFASAAKTSKFCRDSLSSLRRKNHQEKFIDKIAAIYLCIYKVCPNKNDAMALH